MKMNNIDTTRRKTAIQFLLVISSVLTSSGVRCQDESQPAIFLSPRNFNPHPYIASYDDDLRESPGVANNKVGPVVFPRTPEDEDDSGVNSNVVTLGRGSNLLSHPIDNHPYAKVALKHKHQFPSRFNGEDNHINPGVYEALSNHAAKVLSEPPSRFGKDYTLSSLSDQKKNYAFSYKVLDHLTGDDFSHSQSQNSGATNGEYRVKLPDGRVQIVSYVADKNGYKADVKYRENYATAHQPDVRNTQIPASRHPFGTKTVVKPNVYEYQYKADISPPSHLPHHPYEGISSSPSPASFYATTPRPEILYQVYTPQNHHHDRSTVEDDLTNYIGSTLAPFIFAGTSGEPKGYRRSFVSSTIAPILHNLRDEYAVRTPKISIVGNQQRRVVYGK